MRYSAPFLHSRSIDANKKVYTPEISILYRLATNKKDTEVPLNSHLVHRSEVFANLTKPAQALFGIVARGELASLLAQPPRLARPVGGANRRLSPADIDQLVTDYRSGVGSIYDLADLYGVHRNTIAQHLKDRSVRLGPLPLQESEAKRARELHAEGLSLNAIGRMLKRDPKTVKTAIV